MIFFLTNFYLFQLPSPTISYSLNILQCPDLLFFLLPYCHCTFLKLLLSCLLYLSGSFSSLLFLHLSIFPLAAPANLPESSSFVLAAYCTPCSSAFYRPSLRHILAPSSSVPVSCILHPSILLSHPSWLFPSTFLTMLCHTLFFTLFPVFNSEVGPSDTHCCEIARRRSSVQLLRLSHMHTPGDTANLAEWRLSTVSHTLPLYNINSHHVCKCVWGEKMCMWGGVIVENIVSFHWL